MKIKLILDSLLFSSTLGTRTYILVATCNFESNCTLEMAQEVSVVFQYHRLDGYPSSSLMQGSRGRKCSFGIYLEYA